MDPGAPRVHREERLGAEAASGDPDLVGQAAAGSDPSPPGGVLRATVQPPIPRFPTRARVPYRAGRDPPHVDRYRGIGDRKSTRLNSSHPSHLVCRLLLEKKKKKHTIISYAYRY